MYPHPPPRPLTPLPPPLSYTLHIHQGFIWPRSPRYSRIIVQSDAWLSDAQSKLREHTYTDRCLLWNSHHKTRLVSFFVSLYMFVFFTWKDRWYGWQVHREIWLVSGCRAGHYAPVKKLLSAIVLLSYNRHRTTAACSKLWHLNCCKCNCCDVICYHWVALARFLWFAFAGLFVRFYILCLWVSF